jgi:TatD DNase family protein
MKKPYLIDSHVHLGFEAFCDDWQEVLGEALEKKIWVVNVGAGFDTSRKAVEIAQGYSSGVYAAVGTHPIHVLEEDFSQEIFWDLATNNERVVAIGETGLDYFHLLSDQGKLAKTVSPKKVKEKQKKVLRGHLELARITNKPLIFHCRHFKNWDAHLDFLKVLEDFSIERHDFILRGVMHCYTGNLSLAQAYLKLGLYLGFTGIITFSSDLEEVIRETPLERILVETDCPYLSPDPKRGERNVPINVRYVASKIAEIKGVSLEEVAKVTTRNAFDLFDLEKY